MPWKSTTTTGSLPTTQASRPVGSSDTSPALHSRVVPSSITTFIVPEIWYWKCGASQLVVFAIGFTWVDHFQPGSKVPRPMVTPPILTNSTRPFSNVRTSSGAPNPFTSIVAISPPPVDPPQKRCLYFSNVAVIFSVVGGCDHRTNERAE